MPQRNGPQQRQRQQKQHGQDDRGREMLPGPRSPHWGCSACGEDANWACRLFCKGCKRSAPQSVINKAKAATKQQAASGSGPRTPPCPTKSSRPTKEQLEHEALKVENLALRQSRDHYKSKVAEQAAARAGLAAAVDGNQPASQADDESMEQSEDIRAQIKVQRAKVKALERTEEVVKCEMGHTFDVRLDAAKELLGELLQRNQQAKPMDAQLEAAKQSRIRCQKAQEAADAGLEQARAALEQAQAAVLLAEKAAAATAAECTRAKTDYLRVLESCQAVQRAKAAEGVGTAHVGPAAAGRWDP